jgi:hypothetical protein
MKEKTISRIILKEEDIVLISLPIDLIKNRDICRKLYEQIKKQLLPKKNKILMLPEDIKISVIGKDEIKEYISNMDLWELWED